jgi:hypothetical protein
MVGLKRRFNLLQEDIKNIDSGRVPLPHYANDHAAVVKQEVLAGANPALLANSSKNIVRNLTTINVNGLAGNHNPAVVNVVNGASPSSSQGTNGTVVAAAATARDSTTSLNSAKPKGAPPKSAASVKTADQERRKGIPWTEEEHRWGCVQAESDPSLVWAVESSESFFVDFSLLARNPPGFNPEASYHVKILVSSLCFRTGQLVPLRAGYFCSAWRSLARGTGAASRGTS